MKLKDIRKWNRHLAQCWASYVILGVSLALTVLSAHWYQKEIRARQAADFEIGVNKYLHTMDLHFSAYINILSGAASLFARENLVTAEEFKNYLEAFGLRESHVNMYDFGFTLRIRPGEGDSRSEALEGLGFPKESIARVFRDRQKYAALYWDDFGRANLREDHLSPFEDEVRLNAMETAAKDGSVVASKRLILRAGAGRQIPGGFILFAPVYHQGRNATNETQRMDSLRGLVFASFLSSEMWGEICRKSSEPRIRFQVYDGLDRKVEDLLYDSSPSTNTVASSRRPIQPLHEKVLQQHGMGRPWRFEFSTLPEFESTSVTSIPRYILLIGCFLGIAFFGLSLAQNRARLRAEALATDLKVSNELATTESQRLLEEQLKNSKLESVGVLAGGIAHDFNNILTTILGNVSLAALDVGTNSSAASALAEAEAACGRARDLTQQLLTFSKGGAPIRQTALLQDIIHESVRFASHGSNVHCQVTLPEDLWPVEVDKGQISQVIQNIVINAVQSMPEGGEVHVDATNVSLLQPPQAGLKPGRYLRISVQDKGGGIRPEHLPRIFDPYFSTKQTGSGLGLATSHSIVKRHEGCILVDSVLGKGTRFEVYLPASSNPVPSAVPSQVSVQKGQGLVLIMDDERHILRLLETLLGKLGYETLHATDGHGALQAFLESRARGRPVDVVILDLTIPGGMGGVAALAELRKLDPTIKAIVSSGYSNDSVLAEYRAHGFNGVVSKPYNAAELSAVLNKILSSRA